MSKLAQIFQKQALPCKFAVYFSYSLYKTNRFHVAVLLYRIRPQKTSNMVSTPHLPCGSCAIFFLTILTSLVSYNWTYAQHHGIYLLTISFTSRKAMLHYIQQTFFHQAAVTFPRFLWPFKTKMAISRPQLSQGRVGDWEQSGINVWQLHLLHNIKFILLHQRKQGAASNVAIT